MEIGQTVFHKFYGPGRVEKINTGRERPVLIRFDSEDLPDWFTAAGADWSGTVVVQPEPWSEPNPAECIQAIVDLAFLLGKADQFFNQPTDVTNGK